MSCEHGGHEVQELWCFNMLTTAREYEAGAAHLDRKASVGHVEPAVGLHSSRHLCCTLYVVACAWAQQTRQGACAWARDEQPTSGRVTGVRIAAHVDELCDVPGLVPARCDYCRLHLGEPTSSGQPPWRLLPSVPWKVGPTKVAD